MSVPRTGDNPTPFPPLVVDGLVKRYGSRTVLDSVSLEVRQGITGLVGPNGAGKSTLVRAILGLVRLEAGRVRVFGRDPYREPHTVRQRLGVVPEDECSIPGLSGVEMVCYAARLSGLPGTEALRRAHEVLDWCDAGQERYRPVETLSVGMKQKVSFAAAIVHDPDLVILDEPTNGLDPIERRAMLGRLVSLARRHGKTVIVSTHVLPDVESICDDIVVLSQGRICLTGAIADLTGTDRPEYRLVADGDPETLLASLARHGLVARTADEPTGIELRVDATRPERLGAVWEAARDAATRVRQFEPVRRPLEEVFVAALREADHAAP
ncbi:MAG: ABC transporter ATP-binding protein [Planctomycetes bacterium]|nr:ABC transporter ATP-binding protein [Planctomycetota bacterium]